MNIVIANIRGICRAGAVALAGFAILARAQPETRPDLVGRIVPPRGGSARATVIVFGASPKNGGAISLAYPDCGKRAQSDDQGNFKIELLDPQLKFRVLIEGPGCKPQVIDGLVPADGAFTAYLEAADTSLTTTNSVRGRVVDAEGAPVADALLRLSGVRRDDRSSQSGTPLPGAAIAVTDAQGQFILSSKDPYPGHPGAKVLEVTAEIEARGFVKQKATIQVGAADAAGIVLTAGGGMIEGTVVLPDGRPAEGATVALKKSLKSLYLRQGQLHGYPNDTIATTDAAGRFVLPSDAEATAIFASHAAGLGQIPASNSGAPPKIVLQPWGRIEGTFRIGSRPGTNETLQLGGAFRASSEEDLTYDRNDFKTVTDDEGRFVFANVPSGGQQINRDVQQGGRGFRSEMLAQIEVKPGEVTQVTLGGMGRAIIGKVELTPPGGKVDWSLVEIGVRLDKHSYPAKLAAAGSFRADDIPAGKCQVMVTVMEDNPGQMPPRAPVGYASKEVLVPEMPGGRSEETLDVGTIEVPVHHLPAVGVEAALFETQTLDGKPLKLSDYRGRHVLLDLCGKLPGAETPAMEAVAQAFAADGPLVVVTLCKSADANYLAELSKKKVPWISGTLDGVNMEWYGLYSGGFMSGGSGGSFSPNLPAIFLIGPDGKYLSVRLKPEEIQAAVTEALGKK
jgi:hypothetical protein